MSLSLKIGSTLRNPDEDFNTLVAAGNDFPAGIWSDGTTLWAVDRTDDKLYAYNLSTKARDSSKDFDTLIAAGNTGPSGIWSDGITMWVADNSGDKIYAYNLSTKARDSSKDFNTLDDANALPVGIWSDGTTMWVADARLDVVTGYEVIYAYNLSTKARDSDKDIRDTAGGTPLSFRDIWSDGTTMWVADPNTDELYAYNLSTKARDPSKNFNKLRAAGHNQPLGIWSDGTTMWVGDIDDDKIYAYEFTFMESPTASASLRAPGISHKITNEIATQRDTSKDFDTLGESDYSLAGIWSDGTTMWVISITNGEIYAYNLATKARDSSKHFDTLRAAGNTLPIGLWSDGTTMWVGDDGDNKLYAYNLSTKARDSAKDFDTLSAAGNNQLLGIWSDGTTMWVGDQAEGKIYAYNLSTKARDSAKDFDTLSAAGNGTPYDLWSDGTTMWVGDSIDIKIYAYNLSTKARDPNRDFDDTLLDRRPNGIWSDGTTMWVGSSNDHKIYAYNMFRRPFPFAYANVQTSIPKPRGLISDRDTISTDDTTDSWFTTFEIADNSNFDNPISLYDTVSGLTHEINWAPATNYPTGIIYIRARYTSEINDGGVQGSWSDSITYNNTSIILQISAIAGSPAITTNVTGPVLGQSIESDPPMYDAILDIGDIAVRIVAGTPTYTSYLEAADITFHTQAGTPSAAAMVEYYDIEHNTSSGNPTTISNIENQTDLRSSANSAAPTITGDVSGYTDLRSKFVSGDPDVIRSKPAATSSGVEFSAGDPVATANIGKQTDIRQDIVGGSPRATGELLFHDISSNVSSGMPTITGNVQNITDLRARSVAGSPVPRSTAIAFYHLGLFIGAGSPTETASIRDSSRAFRAVFPLAQNGATTRWARIGGLDVESDDVTLPGEYFLSGNDGEIDTIGVSDRTQFRIWLDDSPGRFTERFEDEGEIQIILNGTVLAIISDIGSYWNGNAQQYRLTSDDTFTTGTIDSLNSALEGTAVNTLITVLFVMPPSQTIEQTISAGQPSFIDRLIIGNISAGTVVAGQPDFTGSVEKHTELRMSVSTALPTIAYNVTGYTDLVQSIESDPPIYDASIQMGDIIVRIVAGTPTFTSYLEAVDITLLAQAGIPSAAAALEYYDIEHNTSSGDPTITANIENQTDLRAGASSGIPIETSEILLSTQQITFSAGAPTFTVRNLSPKPIFDTAIAGSPSVRSWLTFSANAMAQTNPRDLLFSYVDTNGGYAYARNYSLFSNNNFFTTGSVISNIFVYGSGAPEAQRNKLNIQLSSGGVRKIDVVNAEFIGLERGIPDFATGNIPLSNSTPTNLWWDIPSNIADKFVDEAERSGADGILVRSFEMSNIRQAGIYNSVRSNAVIVQANIEPNTDFTVTRELTTTGTGTTWINIGARGEGDDILIPRNYFLADADGELDYIRIRTSQLRLWFDNSPGRFVPLFERRGTIQFIQNDTVIAEVSDIVSFWNEANQQYRINSDAPFTIGSRTILRNTLETQAIGTNVEIRFAFTDIDIRHSVSASLPTLRSNVEEFTKREIDLAGRAAAGNPSLSANTQGYTDLRQSLTGGAPVFNADIKNQTAIRANTIAAAGNASTYARVEYYDLRHIISTGNPSVITNIQNQTDLELPLAAGSPTFTANIPRYIDLRHDISTGPGSIYSNIRKYTNLAHVTRSGAPSLNGNIPKYTDIRQSIFSGAPIESANVLKLEDLEQKVKAGAPTVSSNLQEFTDLAQSIIAGLPTVSRRLMHSTQGVDITAGNPAASSNLQGYTDLVHTTTSGAPSIQSNIATDDINLSVSIGESRYRADLPLYGDVLYDTSKNTTHSVSWNPRADYPTGPLYIRARFTDKENDDGFVRTDWSSTIRYDNISRNIDDQETVRSGEPSITGNIQRHTDLRLGLAAGDPEIESNVEEHRTLSQDIIAGSPTASTNIQKQTDLRLSAAADAINVTANVLTQTDIRHAAIAGDITWSSNVEGYRTLSQNIIAGSPTVSRRLMHSTQGVDITAGSPSAAVNVGSQTDIRQSVSAGAPSFESNIEKHTGLKAIASAGMPDLVNSNLMKHTDLFQNLSAGSPNTSANVEEHTGLKSSVVAGIPEIIRSRPQASNQKIIFSAGLPTLTVRNLSPKPLSAIATAGQPILANAWIPYSPNTVRDTITFRVFFGSISDPNFASSFTNDSTVAGNLFTEDRIRLDFYVYGSGAAENVRNKVNVHVDNRIFPGSVSSLDIFNLIIPGYIETGNLPDADSTPTDIWWTIGSDVADNFVNVVRQRGLNELDTNVHISNIPLTNLRSRSQAGAPTAQSNVEPNTDFTVIRQLTTSGSGTNWINIAARGEGDDILIPRNYFLADADGEIDLIRVRSSQFRLWFDNSPGRFTELFERRGIVQIILGDDILAEVSNFGSFWNESNQQYRINSDVPFSIGSRSTLRSTLGAEVVGTNVAIRFAFTEINLSGSASAGNPVRSANVMDSEFRETELADSVSAGIPSASADTERHTDIRSLSRSGNPTQIIVVDLPTDIRQVVGSGAPNVTANVEAYTDLGHSAQSGDATVRTNVIRFTDIGHITASGSPVYSADVEKYTDIRHTTELGVPGYLAEVEGYKNLTLRKSAGALSFQANVKGETDLRQDIDSGIPNANIQVMHSTQELDISAGAPTIISNLFRPTELGHSVSSGTASIKSELATNNINFSGSSAAARYRADLPLYGDVLYDNTSNTTHSVSWNPRADYPTGSLYIRARFTDKENDDGFNRTDWSATLRYDNVSRLIDDQETIRAGIPSIAGNLQKHTDLRLGLVAGIPSITTDVQDYTDLRQSVRSGNPDQQASIEFSGELTSTSSAGIPSYDSNVEYQADIRQSVSAGSPKAYADVLSTEIKLRVSTGRPSYDSNVEHQTDIRESESAGTPSTYSRIRHGSKDVEIVAGLPTISANVRKETDLRLSVLDTEEETSTTRPSFSETFTWLIAFSGFNQANPVTIPAEFFIDADSWTSNNATLYVFSTLIHFEMNSTMLMIKQDLLDDMVMSIYAEGSSTPIASITNLSEGSTSTGHITYNTSDEDNFLVGSFASLNAALNTNDNFVFELTTGAAAEPESNFSANVQAQTDIRQSVSAGAPNAIADVRRDPSIRESISSGNPMASFNVQGYTDIRQTNRSGIPSIGTNVEYPDLSHSVSAGISSFSSNIENKTDIRISISAGISNVPRTGLLPSLQQYIDVAAGDPSYSAEISRQTDLRQSISSGAPSAITEVLFGNIDIGNIAAGTPSASANIVNNTDIREHVKSGIPNRHARVDEPDISVSLAAGAPTETASILGYTDIRQSISAASPSIISELMHSTQEVDIAAGIPSFIANVESQTDIRNGTTGGDPDVISDISPGNPKSGTVAGLPTATSTVEGFIDIQLSISAGMPNASIRHTHATMGVSVNAGTPSLTTYLQSHTDIASTDFNSGMPDVVSNIERHTDLRQSVSAGTPSTTSSKLRSSENSIRADVNLATNDDSATWVNIGVLGEGDDIQLPADFFASNMPGEIDYLRSRNSQFRIILDNSPGRFTSDFEDEGLIIVRAGGATLAQLKGIGNFWNNNNQQYRINSDAPFEIGSRTSLRSALVNLSVGTPITVLFVNPDNLQAVITYVITGIPTTSANVELQTDLRQSIATDAPTTESNVSIKINTTISAGQPDVESEIFRIATLAHSVSAGIPNLHEAYLTGHDPGAIVRSGIPNWSVNLIRPTHIVASIEADSGEHTANVEYHTDIRSLAVSGQPSANIAIMGHTDIRTGISAGESIVQIDAWPDHYIDLGHEMSTGATDYSAMIEEHTGIGSISKPGDPSYTITFEYDNTTMLLGHSVVAGEPSVEPDLKNGIVIESRIKTGDNPRLIEASLLFDLTRMIRLVISGVNPTASADISGQTDIRHIIKSGIPNVHADVPIDSESMASAGVPSATVNVDRKTDIRHQSSSGMPVQTIQTVKPVLGLVISADDPAATSRMPGTNLSPKLESGAPDIQATVKEPGIESETRSGLPLFTENIERYTELRTSVSMGHAILLSRPMIGDITTGPIGFRSNPPDRLAFVEIPDHDSEPTGEYLTTGHNPVIIAKPAIFSTVADYVEHSTVSDPIVMRIEASSDINTNMARALEKRVNELRAFEVDVSPIMRSTDNIASVVSVSASGLIIPSNNISHTNKIVTFYAASGQSGQRYPVTITITTDGTDAQILETTVFINIK